jgi:HEAT repeat protein
MRQLVRFAVLSFVLSTAAVTFAQQPAIVHAQLVSKDASKGLAAELDALKHEGAPVWVGYSVAVVPGFHQGWNGDTDYLEGETRADREERQANVKDQGVAAVLLRVDGNGVEKIRVESPERQLDAGGLKFVWLTGVGAEDSVKTLLGLAKEKDSRRLMNGAVFAISIHAIPAATQALIGLTAAENDLGLREKAAFWLANQRGREGFLAIKKLAREDGDAAFREKLTFDLTLTKEPEAVGELVRMAHEDSAVKVRKQAQFWMAQKGGKVVAGDLRTMAENDPESSLRKSAVFAISRLPKEEATTQLIQLAQTGKDPAVRKQAVFWLGQSNDPKALDYLTQLLQK